MSIRKLKNRIKKIQDEVFGLGGSIIPKEEQVLLAKARTESEANKIFEDLKGKLREKYGDFPDEDVLCFWVKDYSDAKVDEDYKCWPGGRNVKKSYVGWRKLPLPH